MQSEGKMKLLKKAYQESWLKQQFFCGTPESNLGWDTGYHEVFSFP
jgi:hypothetical protein